MAHAPESLQDRAMVGPGGYRAPRVAQLALLAGVLACGGRADSEAAPYPAPAPVDIPSSPLPSAATPARPAPAPAAQTPPRGSEAESDSTPYFQVDAVENILLANCGSCHGPAAPVAGSGGIRFIDDVDQLVAAGLILPLSSAQSPIVRVSVSGSMPPPGSGLQPMTEGDLDVIVSYIDDPFYWPDVPTTPGAARDGGTAPPGADAGVDGG